MIIPVIEGEIMFVGVQCLLELPVFTRHQTQWEKVRTGDKE